MKEFAIYTIGGGELLAKGFNAVAMLMQDGGTMKALVRLGLFTGALMALASALWNMKMEALFKNWALPAFMMLNVCFLPKANVIIHDKVGGNHAWKVANVPWMLGAVASVSSSVFKVVTEKFEQAFSEVDDLQYTKTGVMFGSQLVKKSKMFRITDPVFNENLKSFVNQCVTFAALRGVWYTVDDIRTTNDLWGLVSSKSNWVIHFRWKEPGKRAENCPCREGIERFNRAWGEVIEKGFKDHATAIFPNAPKAATRELKKYLPLAFEQMLEIQSSAEDIMKQQMMAYATMEAIDEINTRNGTPLDLAISRAHLSQEMTHGVLWGMAVDHLPAMKAVFEMLIYMCLLLVIPLTFLPNGFKIIGIWMGLVFWVHLWTPLFAIIYGMVAFLAQRKGISEMGHYGYTLMTSVGVTEAQKTMEGVAGSLAMSIPFISYALVKGGASSFVTLASHLGNVSQTASSQAAHEAMTGNYSAGNMHFGNTTMATNSGFKQDHGGSYSGDTFTHNDGMMSTQTSADGSVIMNQSSSHFRFKIDGTKAITSGLSEQAQISEEMGKQAMVASSTSEADSYRKTLDYALRHGKTIQNTEGWGRTESSSQDKAINRVNSLAEDFAKQNDMTTEQAAQLLADASLGGNSGIISGQLGMKYSSSGEKHETFQKAQKFAQENKFDEALRDSRQSIIEGRYNETDETNRSLADGISASVDKSNQYRTEAQKHYQKSQSYSNVASFAKNSSFSINRDETQSFLEWMATQPSGQGTTPMGMSGAKSIVSDPSKQAILERYQNRFMESKVGELKSYIDSHPSASPEQVLNAYQNTPVKNPVTTIPMETVREGSPEFNDFQIPSSLKGAVSVEVASDRRFIENEKKQVTQVGDERADQVGQGLDQNILAASVPSGMSKIAGKIADTAGSSFGEVFKSDTAPQFKSSQQTFETTSANTSAQHPLSTISMDPLREGSPEFKDFHVPSSVRESGRVEVSHDTRPFEHEKPQVTQIENDSNYQVGQGFSSKVASSDITGSMPQMVRDPSKEDSEIRGSTLGEAFKTNNSSELTSSSQTFESSQNTSVRNLPIEPVREGSPEFKDFHVPSSVRESGRVEVLHDTRPFEHEKPQVTQIENDSNYQVGQGFNSKVASSDITGSMPQMVRDPSKEDSGIRGNTLGETFKTNNSSELTSSSQTFESSQNTSVINPPIEPVREGSPEFNDFHVPSSVRESGRVEVERDTRPFMQEKPQVTQIENEPINQVGTSSFEVSSSSPNVERKTVQETVGTTSQRPMESSKAEQEIKALKDKIPGGGKR